MKLQLLTFSLIVSVLAGNSQAQTLPPPDAQGWMKLFRGNNTSDFYSHTTAGQTNGAFPSATFGVRGDTVQVSGTPTGHFAYKLNFSRYHIRYRIRHVTSGNGGMLLHVREADPSLGVYPRSLECQGDNVQGYGELWTISAVFVNVKIASLTGARIYSPTGTEVTHGDPDGRRCQGSSKPFHGLNAWDTIEAIVYGADSIRQIVDGVTTIFYTKARISDAENPSDFTRPLDRGRIVWQSEGSQVWYHNMEIKLFPGDSLYSSVYLDYQKRYGMRERSKSDQLLLAKDGSLRFQGLSDVDYFRDLRGRNQSSSFLNISALRSTKLK